MATPALTFPDISGVRFYLNGTDLVYVDAATEDVVTTAINGDGTATVALGGRDFTFWAAQDSDVSAQTTDLLLVGNGLLQAGSGADLLHGGGVLDGGAGDDILVGATNGTIFSVAANAGNDIVSADSQGVGTIRLTDLLLSQVTFTADSSFVPGQGFTLQTGTGSITADTSTVRSIVDREGRVLELRSLAGLPALPADPGTNDVVTVPAGVTVEDTRGSDFYLPTTQLGTSPYEIVFTAATADSGDMDLVRAAADGTIRLYGDVTAYRMGSSLLTYMTENNGETGRVVEHYAVILDYFTSTADTQVARWNGYDFEDVVADATANVRLGGGGNDIIRVPAGTDNGGQGVTVHALNGDDVIIADKGPHTLYGGGGNDVYHLRNLADADEGNIPTIVDVAGNNDRLIIEGFDGATWFGGDSLADVHAAARRLLTAIQNTTGVEHLQADGSDKVWSIGQYVQGDSGVISYKSPDNPDFPYFGTAGDDILFAGEPFTGSGPSLFGGLGDDILIGYEDAPNYLYGGSGYNVLIGGSGNDYMTSEGAAIFWSGAGHNTLTSTANVYRPYTFFYLSDGVDDVTGGYGQDWIVFDTPGFVEVDLYQGRGTGGDAIGDKYSRIDHVAGSQYDDILIGNNGDNILHGRGGDDVLTGGVGADEMDGGAGFDTVSYARANSAVIIRLATGQGSYGQAAGDVYVSIEGAEGSNYDDGLYGTSGHNVLKGLNGADTLDGGAGGDMLDGGLGFDVASYASASGAIRADLQLGRGFGNDAEGDVLVSIEGLSGSGFDDVLAGNADVNTLRGLAGDDRLAGRGGADNLYGGSGADRFIYSNISESNPSQGVDTIGDFDRAEGDRIDVSQVDANSGRLGNQAFTFLGTGSFTGQAGEMRYVNAGATRLVHFDVDGDGLSDMQIRVNGAGDLLASDFIL